MRVDTYNTNLSLFSNKLFSLPSLYKFLIVSVEPVIIVVSSILISAVNIHLFDTEIG